MEIKVKVFCGVNVQTLESKINVWTESGEAKVVHWNCMQLTALVMAEPQQEPQYNSMIQSAFGVIIPYEPKDDS